MLTLRPTLRQTSSCRQTQGCFCVAGPKPFQLQWASPDRVNHLKFPCQVCMWPCQTLASGCRHCHKFQARILESHRLQLTPHKKRWRNDRAKARNDHALPTPARSDECSMHGHMRRPIHRHTQGPARYSLVPAPHPCGAHSGEFDMHILEALLNLTFCNLINQ